MLRVMLKREPVETLKVIWRREAEESEEGRTNPICVEIQLFMLV